MDSLACTRQRGKQDASKPKQIVVDSAPWALSQEFEDYMQSLGILVRNENSTNRQDIQNKCRKHMAEWTL